MEPNTAATNETKHGRLSNEHRKNEEKNKKARTVFVLAHKRETARHGLGLAQFVRGALLLRLAEIPAQLAHALIPSTRVEQKTNEVHADDTRAGGRPKHSRTSNWMFTSLLRSIFQMLVLPVFGVGLDMNDDGDLDTLQRAQSHVLGLQLIEATLDLLRHARRLTKLEKRKDEDEQMMNTNAGRPIEQQCEGEQPSRTCHRRRATKMR